MDKHPGTRLSLDRFYKLCPKNLRMAKNITDMCQICEAGKKVEKKLINNSSACISPSTFTMAGLEDKVNYYRQHLHFKDQQQRLYAESVSRTTTSSCLVVMDFKENFRIGGEPVEIASNFYRKSQISVLGFAVQYRGQDGSVCTSGRSL